jgi:hypothetical protein
MEVVVGLMLRPIVLQGKHPSATHSYTDQAKIKIGMANQRKSLPPSVIETLSQTLD